MAVTITGSTNSSNWTHKLVVTENSYSVESNTSSVTVEAFIGRPSGSGSSYYDGAKKTFTVSVTGCANQTISYRGSKNPVTAGSWVSMGSTTFTSVPHEADGSKTILVSDTFTDANGVNPKSGNASGYVTLTTIPRYFSSQPSISIPAKNENSITVNWSTSEVCSTVRYRLNDGGWVDIIGDANSRSGQYTITGLSADTSYKISTDFKRRDSGLWATVSPGSPETTVATYKYPSIKTTPDFTIGDSFVISLDNPLGRLLSVSVKSPINEESVQLSTTGNSVTIPNSDDWKSFWYRSIPEATSGIYKVRLVCNDLGRDATVNGGTFKIKGQGVENPTFNDNDWSYSVTDTYKDLTGNDESVVIAGYSDVIFDVINDPTSNYSATFTGSKSGYVYTWGDTSVSLTKSKSVTISGQNTDRVSVKAYDDRGLYTESFKTLTYINYMSPVISKALTKRTNGIDTETTLSLNGRLRFNGTFGDEGIKNELQYIVYQVKSGGEPYGDPYDITDYTIDEYGNFKIQDLKIHANGSSGGFAVGTKYTVKITVVDALGLLGHAVYEVEVTDGKIARDVYQDSDGDYHTGINGRADSKYVEKIHGSLDVEGTIYKNGEELSITGGGDTFPIAAIVPYSGQNVPSGWLLCDGSEVSRITYKSLFEKIGTTYGVGDGSTTFNLPDLKGRVPIGFGKGTDGNGTSIDFTPLGSKGGEYSHTLTIPEMPSHDHNIPHGAGLLGVNGHDVGDFAGVSMSLDGWWHESKKASLFHLINGENQPHNNVQPFITLNYIIKYEQVTKLDGAVVNEYSESTKDAYSCDYINDKLNEIRKGEMVMAFTAYRSSNVTINNSVIPFNNITKHYRHDGCDASLSNGTVTLSLPDGNYIAKVNASIWTGSNSWDYTLLNIRNNTVIFTRAMAPKINGSWGFVNAEGITSVVNKSKLDVYLNTNGNNFSDGNIGYSDTKMDVMIYKA